MDHFLYKAEYAKSGNSTCRSCQDKINKDHLRLGLLIQGVEFKGKYPFWHHFKCFFKSYQPKTVDQIYDFNLLRLEDQNKIINEVGQNGDKAAPSHHDSLRDVSDAINRITLDGGDSNVADTELQDVAHVYRSGDEIYNAVLESTDKQYYKLQILESEDKKTYWLYRSWGTVGTTIGGKLVESLPKYEAIRQFKLKFKEKTANTWDKREKFVKFPGKMIVQNNNDDSSS